MGKLIFSPDQLDSLAGDIDIFRPSGLNDERRIDLTDHSFVAIDMPKQKRIDDAINVQRLRGGCFAVRIAIADAAQLSNSPTLVKNALAHMGNSPLLPRGTIREISLTHGVRRALVIAQTFSPAMESLGDVSVQPATVNIEASNSFRFGVYANNHANSQQEDPIVDFDRRFRGVHGLRYNSSEAIGGLKDAKDFSLELVQGYMGLANLAVAEWAAQTDVPILYRQLSSGMIHWANAYRGQDNKVEVAALRDGIHDTVDAQPYARITSPLQRATDMVNHLQIAHHLAGVEVPYTRSQLTELAAA